MFKDTFGRIFRTFPTALVLLGLVVLLQGCGDLGRSPLISNDETETPVALEKRSHVIFLGPINRLRTTKPVHQGQLGWRTRAAEIGPSGGMLNLVESNGPGSGDDLEVHFAVPHRSLQDPAMIMMGVYGETLSELRVAFNPDGLQFSPSAQLKVVLGLDRIDLSLDDLKVYHEHEDGTVDEPDFWIQQQGSHIIIRVVVPGFSEYSWDE